MSCLADRHIAGQPRGRHLGWRSNTAYGCRMATDPRRTELGAQTGARALQVGDLLGLRTPEYAKGPAQITVEVAMITGLGTESLEPTSLHAVGHKSSWATTDDDTLLNVGDPITLTGADCMVLTEVRDVHDKKVRVGDIPLFRVTQWVHVTQSTNSMRATDLDTIIGGTQMGPAMIIVKSPPSQEASVGPDVGTETSKAPAPRGKVKASFNLLPEDIEALRAIAKRLGTTVTNVLQRAIRDERFIQEELRSGNKFAVVDREGTVREIIWR